MAPKGKGDLPKVAVDKSFGIKNKMGRAAQKQIKQLKASESSTADKKRREAEKAQKEKEKAKREALELFKPVQVQKVPFGVDPKTVVCQFFKAGGCEKGKKCKFSHDLSLDRKTHKIDLGRDKRDLEDENGTNGADGDKEKQQDEDGMATWDDEKLQKVIVSKHGNPRSTTDKVCKYFIEAVENSKYGWFWSCPNNGEKCMYKHALPPGFKLKTKEQRAAEKALLDSADRALSLEEFLDLERLSLKGDEPNITPESFAVWKRERMDKRAAEEEGHKAKEATGRAMFERGELQLSDEESDDDADDDGGNEGEKNRAWNLAALRKETEALRLKKEEERLAILAGIPLESLEINEDSKAKEEN